MFGSVWSRRARARIAIDLGTSETRFDVSDQPEPASGHGLNCREGRGSPPAVRRGTLLNRVHANRVVTPIIRGVRRVGRPRPRILVSMPSSTPEYARAALVDLCFDAGAGSVVLTCDPVAAAIAAGVEIGSRYAQLILDVGEGVTDLAVLRDGRIVVTDTASIGLQDIRFALRLHLGRNLSRILSDAAASELLASLKTPRGFRNEVGSEVENEVRAADRPISWADVAAPLERGLAEISAAVLGVLRRLPPAVSCEIIEGRVLMVGGGAMYPWIVDGLHRRTGIRIETAVNPLAVVIRGAAQLLDAFEEETGVRESLVEQWTSGAFRRPSGVSPFEHHGGTLPAL